MISDLADQIANLTLAEAVELSRYLDEQDGLEPMGALVPVGPTPYTDFEAVGLVPEMRG